MKRMSKLRVCMACEWVFSISSHTETHGCPMCGWGHYSAHMVYGKAAYTYTKTQKKWLERKMFKYECELRKKIFDSQISDTIGLTFT